MSVWDPPLWTARTWEPTEPHSEVVCNTQQRFWVLQSFNQKDWFYENSEDIQQLLDEKYRLHESYLIKWHYHTDGKLFNLRRLPAKIKILTNIIRNLLMTVLNAGTEADMQCSSDRFSRACAKFILSSSYLSESQGSHTLSLTSL